MKHKQFSDSKYEAQIDELLGTQQILMDDLDKVMERIGKILRELEETPTEALLKEQEVWWRLTSHLLFSMIDAALFNFKQIALLLCEMGGRELTKEDIEKLREQKEDGRPRFLGLKENFEIAFDKLAYALASKTPITKGKEWAVFLSALKTRNRITHPKRRADLKMTLSDQTEIKKTFQWFDKLLRACCERAAKQAMAPWHANIVTFRDNLRANRFRR